MSDTDPYMAPEADKPVVEEVKTEAVEAPVKDEIVVPEGSIKKVLDWVGEDPTKAQKALDAENAGDKRSSLITKLESIVN